MWLIIACYAPSRAKLKLSQPENIFLNLLLAKTVPEKTALKSEDY
jgi:hypothetical protein